ncbi:intersectin-2-like isoform X3 [Porites lutea]|uniref:intersectin-2-like isoform X3 n=1 Tax=Porites lutea TaxID=51062 RepID=UPI003CC5F567
MDCVGPSNLEKFVAVWDFEPSKKDEVALSKGDVVFVLKKYKDGWYRGVRYRGYQAGCFPGNFVVKDSDKAENIEWQDASKEFLSNSSPAPEVNTNILADLEINRGSMTSEGTGTEDQYKDMEDRQPNVNQNGVDRSDSLSSDNSGGLSPGTFTSFHGLNIIADSMSRDGEESEERKRTKAAMELLTSEVSYFNGLNLLSGHYIRPLRKLRIISSEDLKKIFANAESLETISKELVAKLQTRLAHWDVNTTLIGDILVEMFSYVMMFEPYFKSRKRGNEVKLKLEKNNEKFRNFLAKVNCNQTLDSLLLMPIQRVPRYQLILKELVKRTSKDHPDYDNLTEALSKAQKTAEALNEHIRQIENETKVVEVIKSFPNDELNLIRPAVLNSPGFTGLTSCFFPFFWKHDKDHMATLSKSLKSTYIYDGDVERVTKKATGSSEGGMVHETVERHLFLFNHVLLVGMASENLITGKKTYKLKHNIPLAQAWVTPPSAYYTSPPENMFILGTPTQIYKFLAPSDREKTTWVKKLKTYIEKEKQAFVEFFQGLPVPDEQFLAVSIQSKIDYHKTVDLELNLRQGEEVLIIGIKSGGLWLPGLYAVNVCEIELAWWPGLHKGRFGWFPAQCVTGSDVTSITSTNEFHPIPVAVALNVIKRTMMKWTSSSAAIPIFEDPMTLKVFKPDKTFKTCKVHTDCLVSGVLHQYTRHKSFVGGNIDVAVLELWEESLDGSVRRCLDPDEKLVDIFTMWGKYQDKMKLVIHSSKEGQKTLTKKSKKDSKDEPPTGDLITFD